MYSNFFHFKSSNGSFDQVWPKSKHWFLETHTLTEPYMVPNGKVMNTKFVALIKFYILSNGQLFFWKSLNHSILNFERIHSHGPVFGTLEGPDWKSHEYQYCSTHQNLHFIYRPFLHFTKFWEGVVENPQFSHIVSYSLCEIQDLVSIVYLNFLKWKNCVYKKFRSWWYLTTWYSIFFVLSNLVCHLTKFDQNPSWI